MATTAEDKSQPPPAPYSFWWHPEKTWTDCILTALFMWFMPYARLANGPAYEDNDVTTAATRKIREGIEKRGPMGIKPSMTKWANGLPNETAIVEVTLRIPRRSDILQTEYNFPAPPQDVPMPTGDILVVLRLPLSACSARDAALASKGTNEFGCKTVETIDLAKLDPGIPFCVYFHGGGLTVGNRNDGAGFNLARCVSLEAQKPLIMASAEYSLAPTHVFPAVPTESLTVMSYLMKQMPDRSFHVCGFSAGGHVATVAALEVLRKHGSLGSLLSLIPMVHPSCDTKSMYMNINSSCVPTSWLRWCWRCYLALPPSPDDASVDVLSLATLEERLVHGSNCTTWDASPWRKSLDWCRLVDPTVDLPTFGNEHPPIAVLTNRGDPLHDDGVSLVTALRDRGAQVNHLDHGGSHWMGTAFDSKNYQELVETWKEMLFGS